MGGGGAESTNNITHDTIGRVPKPLPGSESRRREGGGSDRPLWPSLIPALTHRPRLGGDGSGSVWASQEAPVGHSAGAGGLPSGDQLSLAQGFVLCEPRIPTPHPPFLHRHQVLAATEHTP